MELIRKAFAKPTVTVFWAWTVVFVILLAVSIFDGTLREDMLRAVDYANTAEPDLATSREDAATVFTYLSVAYFVAVTLIGTLVVHHSAVGRKWAFIALIPLSLWWEYESASAPMTLGEMYPGTIDFWDWVIGVLGGVVWLFISAYTVLHRGKTST